MELLPRDQIAFQQMLDTIRRNFERFGFLPIETPAFELSEVLLTKSGGETERQVYFVQSTGALEQGAAPEMALRFDLTVPLARYVAEHEHEISFPFRRYQMQRVYRGERAQRGRFREFYQCDIDVIGKDALSMRYDAELPAVIHAVFNELAIGKFTIQLNNRKLLRGILQSLGVVDEQQQVEVLREVDKTDKRGKHGTTEALLEKGLSEEAVASLLFVLFDSGTREQRSEREAVCDGNVAKGEPLGTPASDPDLMLLSQLPVLLSNTSGQVEDGIKELEQVVRSLAHYGVPRTHYAVNLAIARGLDYYTGTVYETLLDDYPQIGSICSGGRYENLASHYTKSKLPGVGISIGLTRLFWQLREAGLVDTAESSVEVLVSQMDEERLPTYMAIASELRAGGLNVEVRLEPRKLARQFQYADRAGIRFVVIVGEAEDARGVASVKDLRRAEQFEVARADLVRTLRVELEQARAMRSRMEGDDT